MLAADLSQIAGCSNETIKRVKVNGAMNPMLWVTGVIVPPLLIVAYLTSDFILRYCCIGLVFFIIIAVFGVFIYFAIYHPDKLQSEDFQLRNMAMQIYKHQTNNIVATEEGLAHIANPGPRRISQ